MALEAICSFLDARTIELESDAYPALDELTSKVRKGLLNYSLHWWMKITNIIISVPLDWYTLVN